MNPQEYIDRFTRNGYHMLHNETHPEVNKKLLLTIVYFAIRLLKNKTLGNLQKHQGNKPLFKFKTSENKQFKIHADTTIEALTEFYQNKENVWQVTMGPQGGNVLTNRENGTYIPGLYIYLIR
jgi:hypothetical protein